MMLAVESPRYHIIMAMIVPTKLAATKTFLMSGVRCAKSTKVMIVAARTIRPPNKLPEFVLTLVKIFIGSVTFSSPVRLYTMRQHHNA